jgi:uncharacterized protein (DUF427 family)
VTNRHLEPSPADAADRRIAPGPGQESVWDYPRPPRLERNTRRLLVVFAGTVIADSKQGFRVCETSGPPVFYVPPLDVRLEFLHEVTAATVCEWKGVASYFDVAVGDRVAAAAAWSYREPSIDYQTLAGCFGFFAGRVDACYLDGELVQAQPGDYYGGWITHDIVGPFKGAPGTLHW